MIVEALQKVVDKQDLTYEEAYSVVNEIMSGQTTPIQTAAFLAALSTKSTQAETIEEIAGCAAAMRDKATKVTYNKPVLEIVGTGGDKAETFNISTTASFIIAAGGAKVAKHGNRAASSQSGAADCLEALGININQSPEMCINLLDKINICFLFAQYYHSAMKYVGPIRKELGIRTVFNILGPLTNPASPTYMIMGVYSEALVEPIARVLTTLGVQHGMVVFGTDVLDELSSVCPTIVCEFHHDTYKTYTINPKDFGFESGSKTDLKGGSPKENAVITRSILNDSLKGPKCDTVVLNAAAGLYIAGISQSLQDGVNLADQLIANGKAENILDEYIELSNEDL